MSSKKKLLTYILSAVLFLIIAIVSFVLFYVYDSKITTILFTVSMIASSTLVGVTSVLAVKQFIYTQNKIKSSYNSYVDDILTRGDIGALIYDATGNIIHVSNFIRMRFGKKLVGTSLNAFLANFHLNFTTDVNTQDFKHNEFYYSATLYDLDGYLLIQDKTLQTKSSLLYEQELSVIAELEIDNYSLYQSILSEEQMYNLNKSVVSVLDSLTQEYNLVYRQYNTNGKFLIITNKISLDKMIDKKFDFFDQLHDKLKTNTNNIVVSVSAGFAYGDNDFAVKTDLARTALLQAQGRGGDQVVVMSPYQQPIYFGSTTEIMPSVDRTRIKAFTELFEQKLFDPQIKDVVIYGHAVADLDAIGSALGVLAMAKTYGKNAFICSATQDETTKKALAQYWDIVKPYFIRPQQANKISNENTLVVFVDNAHPTRTDNPEAIKKVKSQNIFILDHHRMKLSIDFAPRENRIVSTAASSASELVTEMLMFAQRKIDIDLVTAQMLLNGICLDTLQFQKHATSKTFEAASWLEHRGANSTVAANALKIDEQTQKRVNKLLENLQEVKQGFYLAYSNEAMPDDLISIAAEEILRIDGRKASFVVAKQEKSDKYKLSARGIDTNVQIICENVGGGGGFAAAAAVSNDDLETFISNIKQAIVGVK
ncbi:DHH family phosphoesterase [Mycoplasma simbae]|uniref:DHH family phosphoesterase n=1 Tax=Mycoplasma simbae TaxID=36744 RepID=UPI0004971E9E|nr:DHH family phosphoesterase [Mycoplasma simbae]